MNLDDKLKTIEAMRKYGGSFVVALADVYERADEQNAARIEMAFPEYLEKYGVGGPFQPQSCRHVYAPLDNQCIHCGLNNQCIHCGMVYSLWH